MEIEDWKLKLAGATLMMSDRIKSPAPTLLSTSAKTAGSTMDCVSQL